MKFVETHSHMYLGRLAGNEDETIDLLQRSGATHSIQVATNISNSQTVIDLAYQYDMIRATVGIHPCEAQGLPVEWTLTARNKLLDLYEKNKDVIVAIWEMWMDDCHTYDDADARVEQLERQEAYFAMQAELALELDMPVIIHTRHYKEETLALIQKYSLKKFVIHCYSEDLEFAQKVISYSDEAMISFTGIVTYPSATSVRETAMKIPLERIMIETDAPYLIPQKYKNVSKYCQPAYADAVLEEIISLRPESPEQVEDQIYRNSVEFFGL